MLIYGLQVNHIARPLGFELKNPRFSYKVLSEKGKKQALARIRVYDQVENVIYDSMERSDIDSLCFAPDLTLAPRTRYSWDVWVKADNGEEGTSPRAWFETGKMDEPWQGKWITASPKMDNACYFKSFDIAGKVKSARLYICGLGLYEAYVNGEKAGDEFLAPGCNDYSSWLQYQTYDVTWLVKEENELCVMLGDGWYKGRFGFQHQSEIYGDTQALVCELHVTLEDGGEQVITSDDTWQCKPSGVTFSNIYDGEHFDATIAGDAQGVCVTDAIGYDRLCERLSPPVRLMHTLRPKEIITTPKGEVVLDLGQEITGYLAFRASAAHGHKYTLRYGEILQDGCFYTDNLRTAKQEFVYVTDGKETWTRPHFTFYGFRYVLLEGFGEKPEINDFVGCVLYSDMERTGYAKTSDERVNRLIDNVIWGQRGNFVDVPTDCPQRDERMGWTGDTQAFCATALYQTDAAAFYTKFMRDVMHEQHSHEGGVPHVIPSFYMQGAPSCAWADVASIVPWTVYQFYGDKELLRQQYDNMKMWTEYIRRVDDETGSHRLWKAGFHFADWLALDAAFASSCRGGTDRDFIASAFYLYSTRLTRKAAVILGYTADAERYTQQEAEILSAIRREWRTPSGRLAANTQTAHILALFLGLMPKEDEPNLKAALDQLFENSHKELRTGFVGTSYLCRVLTQCGFTHLAYSLFLRDQYPGWLYEVDMGATTIWERWNSVMPDGHVSDTGMNSLNHYAYGAVLEWLYRDIAGIDPIESAPGFRRVVMQPRPDARLAEVSFGYESATGRYESAWQVKGDKEFDYQCFVPFGGEAEVMLPRGAITGSEAKWMEKDGKLCATLTAGRYAFHCACEESPWKPLVFDVPFEELLKDERMCEVIMTIAPEIETRKAVADMKKMTLRKLRDYPFAPLQPWQLRRLEEKLGEMCFE